MKLKKVPGPLVILHGKFSGGRNNQHTRALLRGELGLVKEFDGGQHECHGLSGAGLGRTEDVPAVQDVRDGPRLDLRALLVA